VSPVAALKTIVKRTVASPVGWRVAGAVLRKPGVIVLMYHRILGRDRTLSGLPVECFAEQMRWVHDNCDPIGLDAFVDRVARPSRLRPAVLVTFDDGFRDYHDLAYPVLKGLRIPAVVFVATSFLDAGGMIWTDEVQWAVQSTRQARVKLPWSDGPAIELPDAASRDALGEQARSYLKTLPNADRRAAMTALLAVLGEPPVRDRQMLTWDEVRSTMDITRYGGHSHTHPILSRLGAAEAEDEIRTCRDRIAAETQQAPTAFAYPNGRPADYTPETQAILRRNGFNVAFATSEGIAGRDTDWMAVKRLPGDALHLADFVWQASALKL